MIGVIFNGCEVIERVGTNKDKKATWGCLCYCGKKFTATGKSIRQGYIKSCGCYRSKVLSNSGASNKTHGKTGSRLYNIWRGMKKRCYLPTDSSYKNYGAKGITVCEEWSNSFESFMEWAENNGYQDKLTIDRLDNSKGYYPENCRWADYTTQGRNRSNNARMEYKGKILTKTEIAKELGISKNLLHYRITKGIYKVNNDNKLILGD